MEISSAYFRDIPSTYFIKYLEDTIPQWEQNHIVLSFSLVFNVLNSTLKSVFKD